MFDRMIFSNRLLQLRKSVNISQNQLGSALNVSYHTIGKMEKGLRSPSIEVLCALADYFDVSLDYLAGRKDKY